MERNTGERPALKVMMLEGRVRAVDFFQWKIKPASKVTTS